MSASEVPSRLDNLEYAFEQIDSRERRDVIELKSTLATFMTNISLAFHRASGLNPVAWPELEGLRGCSSIEWVETLQLLTSTEGFLVGIYLVVPPHEYRIRSAIVAVSRFPGGEESTTRFHLNFAERVERPEDALDGECTLARTCEVCHCADERTRFSVVYNTSAVGHCK